MVNLRQILDDLLWIAATMSHPAGLPLTAANPREAPAMQPPPGVEAHVTNHSDEQKFFYLCITVATIVPGVLLLIRLYTKVRLVKKVELSDCLCSQPQVQAPLDL